VQRQHNEAISLSAIGFQLEFKGGAES